VGSLGTRFLDELLADETSANPSERSILGQLYVVQ